MIIGYKIDKSKKLFSFQNALGITLGKLLVFTTLIPVLFAIEADPRNSFTCTICFFTAIEV